jgi:beta-lactamase regulating signal transducer with metallopeptidase domain
MNSFIETLNHWGEHFFNFVWPMLWQSNLLIVVLFAFEYLFRRKVRASIRYALWLVVLVKLCTPPTLALPTSPAWWLHQTSPPVVAKPAPHYTVTCDNGLLPETPQVLLPAFVPPKPAMNPAAWLLVASASSSLALLGWLLVRWWQITRQVRRANTSEQLAALAGKAQNVLGTRLSVQVKVTTNSMSPAVCGLFHPTILIPQSLADNFSNEQLRAVLLHELIHLRRRDVWLNFMQALLQIFYWWHPLVWLANARIRRVREEAVDDAVMLALRDEAESYAPTLLEVAKLALNRPLASLGLVGILESRHALRQRIERLLDFHPPRQAGLTLVSLLGILAFTAIAVPMGSAPSPVERQMATAPAASTPLAAVHDTNPPAILINGFIYQMRTADFDKIISGLKFNPAESGRGPWWSASPEKFSQLVENLKSSGLQPITKPRIQTSSGIPATLNFGSGTNGIEFGCTPFIVGRLIDLTIQGKVVDAKANEAATNQFSARTTLENYGGIVIRTKNVGDSGDSNVVVIASVQLVTNLVAGDRSNPPAKSLETMTFKLFHLIREDELREKLLAAGVKIPTTTFFYTDSGILLVQGSREQLALVNRTVLKLNGYSSKEIDADDNQFIKEITNIRPEEPPLQPMTNLFSRHFRVGTNAFIANLQNTTGLQTDNVTTMAKSLFNKLGVDLDLPGKAVFFNDGLGELFVRATPTDLDTVQTALEAFTAVAPQIHTKARFLEVPKESLALLRPFPELTNGVTILPAASFRKLMQTLESNPGTETLAEPEVVTTSGHQTQMRATVIQTIITNYSFHAAGTNLSIYPQTSSVETGPVLDTIPYALSDDHTINLTLIASVTEFLGYDQPPTNAMGNYIKKYDVNLPVVLPSFRVQQASAQVNLWDGQTVVLGKPQQHFYDGDKEVVAEPDSFVKTKKTRGQPDVMDKELLVFITVTLVDPAGNRIHSDKVAPADYFDDMNPNGGTKVKTQ